MKVDIGFALELVKFLAVVFLCVSVLIICIAVIFVDLELFLNVSKGSLVLIVVYMVAHLIDRSLNKQQ